MVERNLDWKDIPRFHQKIAGIETWKDFGIAPRPPKKFSI